METFLKICKRKKKYVKGKPKTFQTQNLLNYRYFADLPFCLELYQKNYMYFKHRVTLQIYFHLL